MNKRVLFVGRQLEASKVFEDALSEAQFVAVSDGVEAITRANKEPFDVVIVHAVDGRSALQLLAEFAQRHPRVVRFLVSNALEDDVFMECISNTHQFLALPCKSEVLKERIARALAADSWLANEKLKSLVARMRTFPTLPSSYLEILKALESPGVCADTIGELLSRDLAITAKLLQTVNSAIFGLARTVTSPSEALFILGVDIVKALVLSVHAYSQLDKVKPLYFTTDKVWNHSLAVATVARRIVQAESGDQNTADAAFTGGLFHDLGKLLLASNFSSEYDGAHSLAEKRAIALHEVEVELFGATHAEMGAYLLALWGLPTPIVEAVAFHHCPARTTEVGFSALTAVHVANVLVHEQAADKEAATAGVDSAYIERLKLTGRLDNWRKCLSGSARPTSSAKPATRPASPSPARASSAPPAPHSNGKRNIAIAAGAFAAVVVVGLLFFRGGDAPTNPVTPVSARENQSSAGQEPSIEVAPVVQTPEPVPGEQSIPQPTVPADEFSAIRLEGIVYRPSNPSALINGKTLFTGQAVAGARVVNIARDSVTVEIGGKQKVLRLTPKP